jgi:hypothetical protein
LPITLSETDDRSLTGTGGDLPNYLGGAITGDHNPRHGQKYFKTTAFAKETLGVYGNSPRRFFHGPGINSTDLAILRDIRIKESHTLQVRAEAFNAFNHTQFNNPNGSINSSAFGLVTSAVNPRVYQFAAKYRF